MIFKPVKTKNIKHYITAVMALGLLSCVVTPPVEQQPDSYLDQRNAKDTDRSEILKKAREIRKGSPCLENQKCEAICDDIYTRKNEREDCYDLSYAQVQRFEFIYDTLKRPSLRDLEKIDVAENGDFDIFVNIDIRSLQTVIGRYKQKQAEEVLTWIAKHEDVALIFQKEDTDYQILDDLLKELSRDSFDALGENIKSSDNFMDVAVEANNELALEWIHDYLTDEHEDCKSNNQNKREKCLTDYCDLGRLMDDDNSDALMDFEYFQEYLEEIIDDGINGDDDTADGDARPARGKWDNDPESDNYIEDIDHLLDWTMLCGY